MDRIAKGLLALIYVWVVAVRWMRVALRHDRLRLRQPKNVGSYWVLRGKDPDLQSYFSEASVAEGRPSSFKEPQMSAERGTASAINWMLRILAQAYAPRRGVVTGHFATGQDREQGIPDEVYTLW
jgi:hypothetical protein